MREIKRVFQKPVLITQIMQLQRQCLSADEAQDLEKQLHHLDRDRLQKLYNQCLVARHGGYAQKRFSVLLAANLF